MRGTGHADILIVFQVPGSFADAALGERLLFFQCIEGAMCINTPVALIPPDGDTECAKREDIDDKQRRLMVKPEQGDQYKKGDQQDRDDFVLQGKRTLHRFKKFGDSPEKHTPNLFVTLNVMGTVGTEKAHQKTRYGKTKQNIAQKTHERNAAHTDACGQNRNTAHHVPV